MNAATHRKDLMKALRANAHRHDLWSVWSDFVGMSAIALSNTVDLRQRDEREAEYLRIVGRYRADEVERFAHALGSLQLCFHTGGHDDVLGSVFMELELGNKWAGQFFTPYHLCEAMAAMTLQDARQRIDRDGFITVLDPATGGGAMLIAAAEYLAQQEIAVPLRMHATAQDIDAKAARMTYVQLSLLGVPAVVVTGNTLTLEERERWYTPAHVMFGWSQRLQRRRQPDEEHPIPITTEPEAAREPVQFGLFEEQCAA